MTASLRFALDLPGSIDHSGAIRLKRTAEGSWERKPAFVALRAPDQKHSLGVHVYSKPHPGGAYELAVRWSNGLVRKNGTGFCGRINEFEALSLAPAGDEDLVLVPEQRYGASFDAMGVRHFVAHGGGHFFPARGVLERRFLLVPRSMSPADVKALMDKSLGFKGVRIKGPAQPWGPARERMPIVNEAFYANLFRAGVAQAQNLLASGLKGEVRLGPSGTWKVFDLDVGALGPFMPDGDKLAGQVAGYEIEITPPAWIQTPEGLQFSAMSHECSMARNPIAWNDLDTGEQLSCHDWPSSEAGRPVTCSIGLIMPAFLNAQRTDYPNFNTGNSAYRQALEGYAADDTAHSIRATDDAKFLAFTAGDPMAMDDLRMLFEHHRAMGMNDRPDARPTPHGSVSWPGYQSLTRDLAILASVPGKGTSRGAREWGWTFDLGVCCSETAFVRKGIDCYLLGVDSCGIYFREFRGDGLLPPGVQGTQMFHNSIDQAAVLRACRLINDYILTARVLDTIRTYVKKVILNPDCRDAKWVYRVRADGTYIDPIGPNDHGPERMAEHIWCVLGLAALCELDAGNKQAAKDFLEAGLTVGMPHGNLDQRLAWCKAQTADQGQTATYQAALELLLA